MELILTAGRLVPATHKLIEKLQIKQRVYAKITAALRARKRSWLNFIRMEVKQKKK